MYEGLCFFVEQEDVDRGLYWFVGLGGEIRGKEEEEGEGLGMEGWGGECL